MSDLIAFLKARIDDDENTAQEAVRENHDGKWATGERWQVSYLGYEGIYAQGVDDPQPLPSHESTPTTRHMARHDPARVLREVALKRRVLDQFLLYSNAQYPDYEGGYATGMEDAVEWLATVYSDHPDFDQKWRLDYE